MDPIDLVILLVGVLGLAAIVMGLLRVAGNSGQAKAEAPVEAQPAVAGRERPVRRRDVRGDAQPLLGRAAADADVEGDGDATSDSDDGSDDSGDEGAAGAGAGAGGDVDVDDEDAMAGRSKREVAKLMKRKEKRELRQREAEARQARDERVSKRDEKYRQKIAAREEERLRREAEAEAEARKLQEKEQAEYDEWKDLFAVEQSGAAAEEEEGESQRKLEEFIRYIKRHKVVQLEALAHEFGMRASDAVSRVQALEQSGRLTGVMDDRGKYIYVTEEELDRVAGFVRQRGRVSVAALARASSDLVALKGEPEEAAASGVPWDAGDDVTAAAEPVVEEVGKGALKGKDARRAAKDRA